MRFWEREFLVEDVNLFGLLARRPTPAAALRASTRDRPSRSPRYVKAIFTKVGVSSRGELVAKLFAERYAPLHFEATASGRVSARN